MFSHPRVYAILCGSILLIAGCAADSSKEGKSMRERQDAALKDPYGYKPDMPRDDVSGGGTFEYDRDAMRKDVDRVLR